MSEVTLRGMQTEVDQWVRSHGGGYWHPLAILARMTEELGEAARLLNHLYGQKPKRADEAEQDLGIELCDLVYALVCLANIANVDLEQSWRAMMEKYRTRDHHRYVEQDVTPGEPL